MKNKILILSSVIIFSFDLLRAQCNREHDSLELVKFYTSMDGPSWRTKWNLALPIDQWFGVSINSNGCVIILSLENNSLNGILFDINLNEMRELDLRFNQLKGLIPDFSNLPNLEDLSLSVNFLSGSIPDFSDLPNLDYLDLSNNQLSGSIPDFSDLPNLDYLDLSYNQFSGSIPNFSNFPNLKGLFLVDNNISGSIPDFSNLPESWILDFRGNDISGSIPNFSNLPNLRFFYLGYNQLSGSLSDLTIKSRFLNILEINENQFSFSDILPVINIYGNKLNCYMQKNIILDSLYYLKSMQTSVIELKIDSLISSNIYIWSKSGALWSPPSGNDSFSNKLKFNNPTLEHFGRYKVKVTNPGVPELTLHSDIISIKVCDAVHDSIQLVSLFNAANGLNWTRKDNWLITSKSITEWFGITTDKLGCVQSINLDNNNLTGTLPVLELNTLDTLILSNNNLSGKIPELVIPFVKRISLRNNQFSGSFPAVMHEWMDLKSLDFGKNNLGGPIPPDLGDLCVLQELRLDSNKIVGELPGELTKLINLKIGEVNFNSNSIDSLKDKIIFFCPYGLDVLSNNPSFDRFNNICNLKCSGTEFDNLASFPWIMDSLSTKSCNDSTCSKSIVDAGFVNVRGIKAFFIRDRCYLKTDSTKNNQQVTFLDCGGHLIEFATCNADSSYCTGHDAISEEEFKKLDFDVRWTCGTYIKKLTNVHNPTSKKYNRNESNILNCYPNPTIDRIISCELEGNVDVKNVSIYDLTGRKYSATFSLNHNLIYIELPDLNSGIYLIEIIKSNSKSFFKMVVS